MSSLRQVIDQLPEWAGDVSVLANEPALSNLLAGLGISWQQEYEDLYALQNANYSKSALVVDLSRWFANILHEVVLRYTDRPDPEEEFLFNTFMGVNDTTLLNEVVHGNGDLIGPYKTHYIGRMSYTAHWLVAAAGALICCMAVLNIVQRPPRNRFAWGYSLNRSFMGLLLLLVRVATSLQLSRSRYTFWIIPVIAAGYSITVVVDWTILYLATRFIHREEQDTTIQPPSISERDPDGVTTLDHEHFSRLIYGQGSVNSPPTVHSQGGQRFSTVPSAASFMYWEVFDPYSEAGIEGHPAYYASSECVSRQNEDPTTESLLGSHRHRGPFIMDPGMFTTSPGAIT